MVECVQQAAPELRDWLDGNALDRQASDPILNPAMSARKMRHYLVPCREISS